MTASVLQESFGDDALGTGTTVTTAALGANCTVGSTLIAWVSASATGTAPSTVKDSSNQSFTFQKTVFNAGVGNQALHLYAFQNNASTAKLTATATWTAAQTGKAIWLQECGGVSATSLDNSQLDIVQAPGGAANAVAGTAITPAHAPTLCVCLIMECIVANASDLAAGTGYTLGSSGWTYGTANPLAKSMSKRIASAVSTAALATAPTNGAAGGYLIGLVMLDEASAGGGAALAGVASSATSATASLSTAIKAASTATDTTSASGALSTAIKLAATASDTTTAAGLLRNNPIQTGSPAWSLGTTAPSTLPALPKAGNQIIVAAFAYTAGSGAIASGIVDNAAGSAPYVKIAAQTDFSNQRRVEYWWCPSVGTISSGTFTVTPTFSVTGHCASALLECSGLTSADQSGFLAPTVAVTTLTATASAPNTNATDFVVGMLGVAFNATNPAPSNPAATGFTSWFNDIGFGTNFIDTQASYKNVSATETSSATWGLGSSNAVGLVATFSSKAGTPAAALTFGPSGAVGTAFISPTGTTAPITTQAIGSTFVVAALGVGSGVVMTAPTDNKGNTYSATPDLTFLMDGSANVGYIWVLPNGVGGAGHTFTINATGNMLAVVTAVEIKSTGGFAIIDQKTVSSNLANRTAVNAPSVTPTVSGAAVLAFLAGIVGTNTTISDAGGYNNLIASNANGATNGNPVGAVGGFIQSVAGPTNDVFAIGASTNAGAASISFIPSGVGAALSGGATSTVSASAALSTAIRMATAATDAITAAASLTAQILLASAAQSAITASGALTTQTGLGGAALTTVTASGTLLPFASVVLTSPLYTGIGGLLDPNFWLQSNLPAVGDTIYFDPTFVTILPNGEIVSTSNNCSAVVQFNDGTGWAVGLIVITPLMVGYALDLNSASATLSSAVKLAGAASSLTTAVGALSTQIKMASAASTLTSASAALSTAIKLAGAAIDTTSAVGGLPGSAAQLSGAASDTTAANADLTTQIALAGAASDFIAATGAIITQIMLAAAAVDTTQAQGGLLGTSAQFAGNATDATNATAVLTSQILLAGAASDVNSALGSIFTSIQILSAALDTTSASGKLGAQILLGWTPRTLNTAYYDPQLQRIAGPLPYAEFYIRVADQLAFAIDWTGFVALVWQPGQMQPMGRTLRPTSPNGYAFHTEDGGQSGELEPIWPNRLGALVNDGSITWECVPVDNSSLSVTVSNAVWSAPAGIAVLAQGQVGQTTTVAIDATQATKGVDYAVNCDVTFSDGETKTGTIVLMVR